MWNESPLSSGLSIRHLYAVVSPDHLLQARRGASFGARRVVVRSHQNAVSGQTEVLSSLLLENRSKLPNLQQVEKGAATAVHTLDTASVVAPARRRQQVVKRLGLWRSLETSPLGQPTL